MVSRAVEDANVLSYVWPCPYCPFLFTSILTFATFHASRCLLYRAGDYLPSLLHLHRSPLTFPITLPDSNASHSVRNAQWYVVEFGLGQLHCE
jgi:hypothetical protein